MNVFVLTFRNASMRFSESAETVGVYASEELVKGKIDEVRRNFLAQGPGYKVQENADGITVYHEMGSMSFVPGVYSYKEHPVVEA